MSTAYIIALAAWGVDLQRLSSRGDHTNQHMKCNSSVFILVTPRATLLFPVLLTGLQLNLTGDVV